MKCQSFVNGSTCSVKTHDNSHMTQISPMKFNIKWRTGYCCPQIIPLKTIKRPSSRVKLDWFKATLFPMPSSILNLSGLVKTQMLRVLKSWACVMTRLIALSPVGSPTSDTITIMLFVFFLIYSSTSCCVTWFIRWSSLAKCAPGWSTNVKVVRLGLETINRKNDPGTVF